MFYVYCPYCAEHRNEEEFHYKGQAHLARPVDPDSCSDDDWGNYLYFRANSRGIHHEVWYHAIGCRKFFNVTRDTQTYQIYESYRVGERPSVTADGVGEP